MVRLKAILIPTKYQFVAISIPYGAIKSQTSISAAKDTTPFQFLMVRLKAVALANQKWLKIWLYD